jgi:hypothetical protein
MKINYKPNKQDIENLSQLDRIEYNLDKRKLEEENPFFGFTNIVLWKAMFPIMILYFFIYWFGYGEHYSTALNIFKGLFELSIKFLFFGVIMDIIILISYYFNLTKLNNKYFKGGVKWQKKKK